MRFVNFHQIETQPAIFPLPWKKLVLSCIFQVGPFKDSRWYSDLSRGQLKWWFCKGSVPPQIYTGKFYGVPYLLASRSFERKSSRLSQSIALLFPHEFQHQTRLTLRDIHWHSFFMVRLFRTYDSRRSQPDGDGLVHPIGDHMSALPGRTYWRGPTSSSVLAAQLPKANMQDGTQFDWVMETLFDDHLRAWVRLRTVISVQGFSGLGRRSSVHRRTHAWIGEENSFSSVEGFRFRKFWPAKRRGFSWSEPQVPKSPKKSASRDPPLRRLFFYLSHLQGCFLPIFFELLV